MAVLKILGLFLLLHWENPVVCQTEDYYYSMDENSQESHPYSTKLPADNELTHVRTKNLSGNVKLTTLQVLTTNTPLEKLNNEFENEEEVISDQTTDDTVSKNKQNEVQTITENQQKVALLSEVGTKAPTDGMKPFDLMDVFNSTSGTLPDQASTEKLITVTALDFEQIHDGSETYVPEVGAKNGETADPTTEVGYLARTMTTDGILPEKIPEIPSYNFMTTTNTAESDPIEKESDDMEVSSSFQRTMKSTLDSAATYQPERVNSGRDGIFTTPYSHESHNVDTSGVTEQVGGETYNTFDDIQLETVTSEIFSQNPEVIEDLSSFIDVDEDFLNGVHTETDENATSNESIEDVSSILGNEIFNYGHFNTEQIVTTKNDSDVESTTSSLASTELTDHSSRTTYGEINEEKTIATFASTATTEHQESEENEERALFPAISEETLTSSSGDDEETTATSKSEENEESTSPNAVTESVISSTVNNNILSTTEPVEETFVPPIEHQELIKENDEILTASTETVTTTWYQEMVTGNKETDADDKIMIVSTESVEKTSAAMTETEENAVSPDAIDRITPLLTEIVEETVVTTKYPELSTEKQNSVSSPAEDDILSDYEETDSEDNEEKITATFTATTEYQERFLQNEEVTSSYRNIEETEDILDEHVESTQEDSRVTTDNTYYRFTTAKYENTFNAIPEEQDILTQLAEEEERLNTVTETVEETGVTELTTENESRVPSLAGNADEEKEDILPEYEESGKNDVTDSEDNKEETSATFTATTEYQEKLWENKKNIEEAEDILDGYEESTQEDSRVTTDNTYYRFTTENYENTFNAIPEEQDNLTKLAEEEEEERLNTVTETFKETGVTEPTIEIESRVPSLDGNADEEENILPDYEESDRNDATYSEDNKEETSETFTTTTEYQESLLENEEKNTSSHENMAEAEDILNENEESTQEDSRVTTDNTYLRFTTKNYANMFNTIPEEQDNLTEPTEEERLNAVTETIEETGVTELTTENERRVPSLAGNAEEEGEDILPDYEESGRNEATDSEDNKEETSATFTTTTEYQERLLENEEKVTSFENIEKAEDILDEYQESTQVTTDNYENSFNTTPEEEQNNLIELAKEEERLNVVTEPVEKLYGSDKLEEEGDKMEYNEAFNEENAFDITTKYGESVITKEEAQNENQFEDFNDKEADLQNGPKESYKTEETYQNFVPHSLVVDDDKEESTTVIPLYTFVTNAPITTHIIPDTSVLSSTYQTLQVNDILTTLSNNYDSSFAESMSTHLEETTTVIYNQSDNEANASQNVVVIQVAETTTANNNGNKLKQEMLNFITSKISNFLGSIIENTAERIEKSFELKDKATSTQASADAGRRNFRNEKQLTTTAAYHNKEFVDTNEDDTNVTKYKNLGEDGSDEIPALLEDESVEKILYPLIDQKEEDKNTVIGETIGTEEFTTPVTMTKEHDVNADSLVNALDAFNAHEFNYLRTDSNETEPQISVNRNGEDLQLSIKITDNETSYFIPSDAFLSHSSDTINITWKSTTANINNSLQVNVGNSVQLHVVKGTEMSIHTAVFDAENVDELEDTITFDSGVNIYFSKPEILKRPESSTMTDALPSLPKHVDILTAEIIGACLGLLITVVLVVYGVVKKIRGKTRNFKPNGDV